MKKLIEALHVIQDECSKHDECEKCPLYNYIDGCKIREVYKYPIDWKINDTCEGDKVLL